MKRFAFATVAVMILSLPFVSVARADIAGPVITANNSIVFQSNGFESNAVNSFPGAALTGAWAKNGEVSDAVVKAGGSGGVPAAAYGNNVLAFPRPADPNVSRSIAEAVMSREATAGETVDADFSLYVNTEAASRHFVVSFLSPGGGGAWGRSAHWVGYMSHANAVAEGLSTTGLGADDWVLGAYTGVWDNVYKASDGTPMGMSPNAWHNIEMKAIVGSTYTVAVDGVPSEATALTGAGNISSLVFQQNSYPDYPQFFVDGPNTVPEPSTLLLLLTAVAGLLAYAWRKRR